jgi:hypothetical protein
MLVILNIELDLAMIDDKLPEDINLEYISKNSLTYKNIKSLPGVEKVKTEIEKMGFPFEVFESGIYQSIYNAQRFGFKNFSIKVTGLPKKITIYASLDLKLFEDY